MIYTFKITGQSGERQVRIPAHDEDEAIQIVFAQLVEGETALLVSVENR